MMGTIRNGVMCCKNNDAAPINCLEDAVAAREIGLVVADGLHVAAAAALVTLDNHPQRIQGFTHGTADATGCTES